MTKDTIQEIVEELFKRLGYLGTTRSTYGPEPERALMMSEHELIKNLTSISEKSYQDGLKDGGREARRVIKQNLSNRLPTEWYRVAIKALNPSEK